MKISKIYVYLVLGLMCSSGFCTEAGLRKKEQLGKRIFFDSGLSEPVGQSCASCHQPGHAFADPGQVVSHGANPALFGNRNAPSISYIRFNPEPSWNAEDKTWVGGFFLDGRARSLREQASGPLLNPLEMGNRDAASLVKKIRSRPYASTLTDTYGKQVWENDKNTIDAVSDAIVSYEMSRDFAPFSSKYDAYLRGEAQLTPEEKHGLELFEDEKKGNCAACHPSKRNDDGSMPLFTDYSYDNLGVPRNTKLPYYTINKKYNPQGNEYTDYGLGDTGYAKKQNEKGKFKVQTLRNIANTAPYMHNGAIKTLGEVIEFYNSRDVDSKWHAAEVAENVNKDELGNLKLTKQEVEDIVAFLNTLSDGYRQ